MCMPIPGAGTTDNGLRQNPTKFPTDANGNLDFVPGIMKVDAPPGTPFDPNNVYYDPQEDVYIKDLSAAVGFRGTTPSDWDWDISNNLGRNDFHYWGNKTFNASLPYVPGQPIQTRFDDGGFNFTGKYRQCRYHQAILAHVAQGLAAFIRHRIQV